MTTTYKLKVLSAGSGSLTNIIYDFSGSSYHYNADLGTGANLINVTARDYTSSVDLLIDRKNGIQAPS